jgi:hypothetical protein
MIEKMRFPNREICEKNLNIITENSLKNKSKISLPNGQSGL